VQGLGNNKGANVLRDAIDDTQPYTDGDAYQSDE
jgi:hypothetical protein